LLLYLPFRRQTENHFQLGSFQGDVSVAWAVIDPAFPLPVPKSSTGQPATLNRWPALLKNFGVGLRIVHA
jgi:hypothetical protein